eukprot:SAG31_NODE_3889_length_3773_cov_10.825721_4_plen_63_part_00
MQENSTARGSDPEAPPASAQEHLERQVRSTGSELLGVGHQFWFGATAVGARISRRTHGFHDK